MAQGDHPELQAHLDAALGTLLNAVAHHEGHNALGLVILDNLDHLGGVIGLAQHNSNTGNIAGNQGHAQGTDDGIGNEADAGLVLVGVAALHILEAFNDLGAHGSGKTGVQGLAQILLIGDQALEHAHAGRQITQGLNLNTGSRVNRGEEIGGIGECDFLICAVLGNGIVHSVFGQARNRVGTTVNQIG